MAATLGAHEHELALWHQEDDAPQRLVMHGPYAHVRHPFYSSFLLALLAGLLAAPGALTAVALGWGAIALHATAVREERRLLASAFGAEYRQYRGRTGRFVPRLLAAAS
jgi:protein-S-isoprenylcysteine O-methyltransferase Ste14